MRNHFRSNRIKKSSLTKEVIAKKAKTFVGELKINV